MNIFLFVCVSTKTVLANVIFGNIKSTFRLFFRLIHESMQIPHELFCFGHVEKAKLDNWMELVFLDKFHLVLRASFLDDVSLVLVSSWPDALKGIGQVWWKPSGGLQKWGDP